MYCCKKCGSVIDLGFCETDCPRGCYDQEDNDDIESIDDIEENDDERSDDDETDDDEI